MPAHSKCSGDGGSFLLLITSLGNDVVVHRNVFLQVEWGNTENRNVDLHTGIEWARGVLSSGTSPGKRCQHRRHLPTQTGTRPGFVCFVFSLCPTLTHRSWEFSNYGLLYSLILFPSFILFPHSLPFPFLAPIGVSCPPPLPPLQGHSRRVQVTVKPVQHSGTLPLMVEAILSVSIGCVTARSTKLQRGLDSYQVRPTDWM